MSQRIAPWLMHLVSRPELINDNARATSPARGRAPRNAGNTQATPGITGRRLAELMRHASARRNPDLALGFAKLSNFTAAEAAALIETVEALNRAAAVGPVHVALATGEADVNALLRALRQLR
jgi:hypothetical protein